MRVVLVVVVVIIVVIIVVVIVIATVAVVSLDIMSVVVMHTPRSPSPSSSSSSSSSPPLTLRVVHEYFYAVGVAFPSLLHGPRPGLIRRRRASFITRSQSPSARSTGGTRMAMILILLYVYNTIQAFKASVRAISVDE